MANKWTPEQEREIRLFNRRMERLLLAIKLGETALLRLLAECLLEMADRGEIPLTDAERDELDRIAVAPTEGDKAFLAGFSRAQED